MATYSVKNFLAKPSGKDTRIRIYDKNKNLKYTLDPNISYFYVKANDVIIRVDDRNSIYLDFPNISEATLALSLLNQAKKDLTKNQIPPKPCPGSDTVIYSKINLNMQAKNTVNDGDLACNNIISDEPVNDSHVRVFINGIEVNVGGREYPYDCYFSPDGGTSVRILGDERIGDKLYWNQSIAGYNLDEIDLIDFIYLIFNDC